MSKRAKERRKGMVRAVPKPQEPNFWLLAAVLCVACIVAYAPALNGGPIWDDDRHMTQVELKSLRSLGDIWTRFGTTPQYYPLVYSAFWLQRQFWGGAVFPHHLINVLLHVGSALLLVRILRVLAVPGAWLAGAIFALHPVHVESVAWISELKNTLSGVFCLSAAWFYLKFDTRRDRINYAVSLGLFALGLLTKSVIASLPAALLVVFWWQRGRLSWRRDAVPLVPFFLIGVSAGLFTAWFERHFIGAQGSAFDFSALERCLIAGRVFWFYLAKLFWPANLIFTYPRWDVSQLIWWQYLFPFAALLLTGACWWFQRRSRAPLAALLLFGGTLFPVLGFVNVYPFIYSFVADHFQYLASIAVIAIFAAFVTVVAQRYSGKGKGISYGIPFLILVSLGVLTWRQAHAYRDAETLYLTTLERNPNSWMAHVNLGIELAANGRTNEAIGHYSRALAIEPNNPQAYTNLANIFLTQGRAKDAIANYEKTLEISPSAIQPKNNLAWLLATSPDSTLRSPLRALVLAQEAVRESRGTDPVILRTLAAAYAANSLFQEAAQTAEAGVRLAQDHPEWAIKLEREAKSYRASIR